MITVADLLSRARNAIKSGETALHAAAEDIAAAQQRGATQRQIAQAVGKSVGWVNRLLKWRLSGYQDDTAFGPQAKASRARVQARERKKGKPATTGEQAQAAAERARAETAKAEAAKAKADAKKSAADASKAKADARKAEADAAKARANARKANAKSNTSGFFRLRENALGKDIDARTRDRLVKALGMLGSAFDGERLSAASAVEQYRRKLGLTWDELIIPASEAEARAA